MIPRRMPPIAAALLCALLLWGLAATSAFAHLAPNARTRTFVIERGADALTLYARIPAPLVYAGTMARRRDSGDGVDAPYLRQRLAGSQLVHDLDLGAIRDDPDGFAAVVAAGYDLRVADGSAHPLERAAVRIRAVTDLPPFYTPDQARAAMAEDRARDPDSLFVGDAYVDVALVYGGIAPGSVLSLTSNLPVLQLPPGIFVDNHIVDVGLGGTNVRAIVGQLEAPVVLPPPTSGPWWTRDLRQLLAQGTTGAAVLVALAALLGALHALEPGHAKTLMAAFIIAVRGTTARAVLLGGAVALSHSLIVVLFGILALTFGPTIGDGWAPLFTLASGLIIAAIGVRTVVPSIRFGFCRALVHRWHHAFGHRHGHGHHHVHDHADLDDDAHARAHAADIRRRFPDRQATTGQVLLFGLGSGLIPCAAAVTVLLVCLQIDRVWLGAALLAAFMLGLAATLVSVGIAASWGLRAACRHVPRFDRLVGHAPLLSGLLIVVLGLAMMAAGAAQLAASGDPSLL